MTVWRLTAAAVMLLAVLLAAGCSRKSGGGDTADQAGVTATPTAAGDAGGADPKGEPIRIGEYGSLTGSTATFGISTKNGVDMAIKEINAAGGVLGRPLQVFVEDDRGQATEAATVVTRLINQQRVVAVLGEVASKLSLTAGPICQQSKVPMITPASTNPDVTKAGDYVFRICFIDPFQGTVMARFAHGTLKAKKVAVLYDVSQDYSQGLAQFFREESKRLGMPVTANETFSSNDSDFKAQLTKIAAGRPDAVFVPGYYQEVGLIARQAREVGLNVPLLGGDGWDSPDLMRIGGTALNGNYFSTHYSAEDTSPQVQSFVKVYKEKYGDSPDCMAALGYDAAKILADAIRRAGSTEPEPLRDAIAKTAGYQGVTGSITLDAERNAKKSAVVMQIKDGKVQYMQTVAP